MPRELLLEVILGGPILNLEHLVTRRVETLEERLHAHALTLTARAVDDVHATIRDGRGHRRRSPAPDPLALNPADNHRVASAPVLLKVTQRGGRRVRAAPPRVHVRVPRRPHRARVAGRGHRADRGVAARAARGGG